jgi:pyridoxal phosphate-dependent aminotransferase EpsN
MSNVLAAIGRGQLRVLPERIAARRRNFEFYSHELGAVPGIEFMPRQKQGSGNYWLTCITIEPAEFGATREQVRLSLEAHNIEARPVWKPLHMQPVFAGCRVRGGERSAAIFKRGLCLPSGSNLTRADLERVCSLIVATPKTAAVARL